MRSDLAKCRGARSTISNPDRPRCTLHHIALSTDAASDEPSTLYLVKRLELVMRSLLDDALRPRGITTLQFTALSVLARHDGLSSAALARRSFVTPQTMNEMVHWLERHELVDRERDPANRRVLLIRLAPAGRRLVDECAEVVRTVEDHLRAGTGEDEHRGFRDALRRGYEALLPLADGVERATDSVSGARRDVGA